MNLIFGKPKLPIIKLVFLRKSNKELVKSNRMDFKIAQAKKDFEEGIRLAVMDLSQFRISKQELRNWY